MSASVTSIIDDVKKMKREVVKGKRMRSTPLDYNFLGFLKWKAVLEWLMKKHDEQGPLFDVREFYQYMDKTFNISRHAGLYYVRILKNHGLLKKYEKNFYEIVDVGAIRESLEKRSLLIIGDERELERT